MSKGLQTFLSAVVLVAVAAIIRLWTVDHYILSTTQEVIRTFDEIARKQHDRAAAQKVAADGQRQANSDSAHEARQARCYILAADGRVLTCQIGVAGRSDAH